jgi:hypothetical protein
MSRKQLRSLPSQELSKRRADSNYNEQNPSLVTCRICGIQMENLGSRGKAHANHLLDVHGKTPAEYQDFCETNGWGRPPVTSLASRNRNSERRREHPEQVKAHNQKAEKRRALRRKTDPAYGRKFFDKVRARRQKKLSIEEKAARIPCPIPNSTGEPCGTYLKKLPTHISLVHGWSIFRFKREFPDVPLFTPEELERHQSLFPPSRRPLAEGNGAIPRKRGRKPGSAEATQRRIEIAAALSKLGWTQKAMAPFVYHDTPRNNYLNTRNLFARFREKIRERTQAMTPADCESLAKQVQRRRPRQT